MYLNMFGNIVPLFYNNFTHFCQEANCYFAWGFFQANYLQYRIADLVYPILKEGTLN